MSRRSLFPSPPAPRGEMPKAEGGSAQTYNLAITYPPNVMQSFVALDVETANPNYASICAIGAARFDDGVVVDQLYQLIDPRDLFGSMNVRIHGIRATDVSGQPVFPEVAPELETFVNGSVVVHHGHFDRNAIARASERWQLPPPNWDWLDSAQTARRAWPQFAQSGYGLANVCQTIGYEFQHHNALDDAKAAGEVVLAASRRLGVESLAALAHACGQTPVLVQPREWQRGLWPEHDQRLGGEVIVFASDVDPLRSERMSESIRLHGGEILRKLSPRVTLLVVSDQALRTNRASARSSQHRRAEQWIAAGRRVRILSESALALELRGRR